MPPVETTKQDLNLKNRLVNVTIELLLELRAVKLPTMRAVADRAGVAPGAAYRHFDSQASLLLAVVTELFDQLAIELAVSAYGSSSDAEKVRRFAHAYVRWGLENAGAYQLAIFLGRLLGHDEPDENLAALLWAQLHGLVSLRNHKTGMNWGESLQSQVDRIVDMALPAQS
jgi:AcrR family transcriptional regulator